MMGRLDRFRAWQWAVVFLNALAVPALAIEQQESQNREAAMNMIDRSKVVRDALASAEQISRALSQSGYKAGFSLESLKQVDRFFEEQVSNGQPRPGGLLSQQLVHDYLQLVPTSVRLFVGRMEESGRAMTMTLEPRSILPFALKAE